MDGVTQQGTYMDMGMFGADGYYFFYLKFVPPASAYQSSGSNFGLWFQVGNEESDW